VYAHKRETCEFVAAQLSAHGVVAEAYHAGLPDKTRMAVQQAWVDGRVRVVVATVAFGMGIDKADVRFVVHFNMAKSIEGYSQEAGRAGRDGLRAHCRLYYTLADRQLHEFLLKKNTAARRMAAGAVSGERVLSVAEHERRSNASFFALVGYCETALCCRQVVMARYFGEQTARPCFICDVCRDPEGTQRAVTLVLLPMRVACTYPTLADGLLCLEHLSSASWGAWRGHPGTATLGRRRLFSAATVVVVAAKVTTTRVKKTTPRPTTATMTTVLLQWPGPAP
jgi:superfamily II DNA helicase RecQ